MSGQVNGDQGARLEQVEAAVADLRRRLALVMLAALAGAAVAYTFTLMTKART